MSQSNDKIPESLLGKVRALLAKAEDPGATSAEAKAFTAKATELMAKYGIERAVLADAQPDTDIPGDRIVTIDGSWAREKQGLLAGLIEAMRGRAVLKTGPTGYRVHLFGYASDLERAELLYTSLLLQMANGLAKAQVPWDENPRTYRRSWILGFRVEVVQRVKDVEARAESQASAAGPRTDAGPTGRSAALVLADRKSVIDARLTEQYPKLKARRATYRGSGFGAGRAAGSRANIGQTQIGGRRAIGGAR